MSATTQEEDEVPANHTGQRRHTIVYYSWMQNSGDSGYYCLRCCFDSWRFALVKTRCFVTLLCVSPGPKGVINDWRRFKLDSVDQTVPQNKRGLLRQMSSPRDDDKERLNRKVNGNIWNNIILVMPQKGMQV